MFPCPCWLTIVTTSGNAFLTLTALNATGVGENPLKELNLILTVTEFASVSNGGTKKVTYWKLKLPSPWFLLWLTCL